MSVEGIQKLIDPRRRGWRLALVSWGVLYLFMKEKESTHFRSSAITPTVDETVMQQPPQDVSINVLLFSMLKVVVEFFLESAFHLDVSSIISPQRGGLS